jgi:hypothetical protein
MLTVTHTCRASWPAVVNPILRSPAVACMRLRIYGVPNLAPHHVCNMHKGKKMVCWTRADHLPSMADNWWPPWSCAVNLPPSVQYSLLACRGWKQVQSSGNCVTWLCTQPVATTDCRVAARISRREVCASSSTACCQYSHSITAWWPLIGDCHAQNVCSDSVQLRAARHAQQQLANSNLAALLVASDAPGASVAAPGFSDWPATCSCQ